MPRTAFYLHFGRLERFLKKIAFRLKCLIALEFLLRLASVFLIALLGDFFIQRGKEALAYLPFIYYLSAASALILLLLFGVWRTSSKQSMESIARRLEEKLPHLKDDVTNSLLLFQEFRAHSESDQTSEGLVSAHMQKTADEVLEIPSTKAVNFREALPLLRIFLLLLLVFMAALAMDPQCFNRSLASILHPFSSLPERETSISVEPAPSIVLRGTPVVIKARAAGTIPDRLLLRLWPEQGKMFRAEMETEGGGSFIHRITSPQISFRYQVFSGKAHSAEYEVKVVEAPDIEKIRLTLIPPRYTRLPREVKEEGHIEALKGTVVNLEARATKSVKEGRLILNQKDQLPLEVEGDQLKGYILVFYPGSYSLLMTDDLGFENSNPVLYRIRLIPDQYPEVEIISPKEDLEVLGNEVLPLLYAARDDFGLTAIRLLYQRAGTERSIALKNPRNSSSSGLQRFKWDLSSLALTSGDRVAYRLEALDNDSVSGPKAGYSRTFTLLVRDERNRAAEEAQRAQEVADALLDLLADHLEEIKDRKALSQELTRITEEVDKYLERLGIEKMERFNLEPLKRNLDALNRRIEELPKETVTQEIERLALHAEDLVKKARMNEVEALAREIRNRQQQLIDSLRDQRGPLTPETLQALSKEIERLKELISRVMEALSRMASQLPDEFVNSPDLSGLDFQDLFTALEEIRKKLMAGDLAGALEAAQRLLQDLSEMMAAMGKAGNQANMGSMDRLQSEMSRQAGELEKILAEQKEILRSTESIDRELKRLSEEEIDKRLREATPRLEEAMEELHRLLPPEQRESVLELERLLKEKKIQRLSQLAQGLAKAFSGNPDVQKLFDEWMKIVKELTPDPSEVTAGESREKFPGLSSREKKLQEKTADLGEKLEVLSQLFPGMDTEILNDLKDAAGSMGRASGKLAAEDASGAIQPEEEAIRSLTRSQQAMQQMAQQMAMRMQANRWGYPWGYDPRPGWYYGPWAPMPTLPQPEFARQKERGYTGIDREEFDPPSKDAYHAPQSLREKVTETLKEEIPAQYRREIERYFRGLTE